MFGLRWGTRDLANRPIGEAGRSRAVNAIPPWRWVRPMKGAGGGLGSNGCHARDWRRRVCSEESGTRGGATESCWFDVASDRAY